MKREKLYYVINDDEISASVASNLGESGLDDFMEAVDYEGTIYTESEFVRAWYDTQLYVDREHLRIIEFQTCSCGWRGPVHHLIKRTETSQNQKEMLIEDCPSCGITVKRQKA